jgi:hypothetical protein
MVLVAKTRDQTTKKKTRRGCECEGKAYDNITCALWMDAQQGSDIHRTFEQLMKAEED